MQNKSKPGSEILVPPIMWAGGKRWLAPYLVSLIPTDYKWYFEPFVGGAAAFCQLRPERAVLSDINGELIAAYQAIKDDWKAVCRRLNEHRLKHSDDYYYNLRSSIPRTGAGIAARLMYLNRTCWNGLYRVNLNGQFNVPRGTKDEVLLDTDNFELLSEVLQGAELIQSDFEMVIDCAGAGDVVYADPPYTVKHNFNGFVKYNESIFTWADQERLANAVKRAHQRGAHVIVSNANHDSVRQLYEADFTLHEVRRTSKIAASAKFRGEIVELLVVGR